MCVGLYGYYMGIIWVLCGYYMGIIWVLYGYYMGIIWVLYGYYMGIIWVLYGYYMGIIWVLYGYYMGIIWVSYGYYMGIIWVLYGYYMGIIWVLYGYYMGIIWVLYGYYMGIIWVLYGYYMGIIWVLYGYIMLYIYIIHNNPIIINDPMDMEHNGPPHLDVQGGRPSPKRRCSTCQNQFRKVGSSEQKRRKNIGNHGESWKVMKKYGECGKKMEKIMIPISKSHGKFWILADVIEFHQQNSMKTGDPIGKQHAARLKKRFPLVSSLSWPMFGFLFDQISVMKNGKIRMFHHFCLSYTHPSSDSPD